MTRLTGRELVEHITYWADAYAKEGGHALVVSLLRDYARAIEAELSKQEPVANKAHWFALVMNATAAIEDASNCLRDPDAKRAADGAAKHYRDAANALYTAPLPSAPDTVQVPPSANCWLNGGPCIGGRCDEPRFCAQNDTIAAAPKSTP